VREPRGIADHVFGLCVGFFAACVLVYIGVQLLRSVLSWLIAGAVLLAIVMLIGAAIRWRRERW
jgi:hypothetical protein